MQIKTKLGSKTDDRLAAMLRQAMADAIRSAVDVCAVDDGTGVKVCPVDELLHYADLLENNYDID